MLLDRNGGLVFEYKSMGNGDPDEIVPLVRKIVDLAITGNETAMANLPSLSQVNVMVSRSTAGTSGRYTEAELRRTAELAGLDEARVKRYIAGENILTLTAEQRRSE